MDDLNNWARTSPAPDEQPTLFDFPKIVPADARLPLRERFQKFHSDNPAVYRHLVRLARERIARTGEKHLGIAALVEVLRWDVAVQTLSTEWKFDNSLRAPMARLIMAQEPDLAGVFETRRSVADNWDAAA